MHHKKLFILLLSVMLLAACTKHIENSPSDFIPANRVVENKTSNPEPKVAATFGLGNDPEVVKAYEEFSKNGVAKNIRSQGFETFAYDAYSHPMIACAPLHLCVIQLERAEKINNIQLGDSAHWLVATSLVGSEQDGSYQVALKPKLPDSATDLIITTDKRTYNIGLVSKQDATTHVVSFYYPEETLTTAIEKAKQDENTVISQQAASQASVVDVDHLNFNYEISGDHPAWQPVQVFDDGTKTFIRMAPISERMDLPVLYVRRNHEMQLINYRYRRPYYVIDGLFEEADLISGKGRDQERVVIKNRNFN